MIKTDLDTSNFIVITEESQYYITNGINGLKKFALNNKIDYNIMTNDLLVQGFYTIDDNSEISIV